MEFDKEFLRWFLLIGASPIWLPVLLTLWRDFNRALREEGGLFGRPPGPAELERMRRERATEGDPLVSEPWVRRGERRRTSLGHGPRAGAPAAPVARPARAAPKFRSSGGAPETRARGFR